MKKIKIAGIRQILDLSQIDILSLPAQSGHLARVLTPLAENRINLEFIMAHTSVHGTQDLILGVKRNYITAALGLVQGMRGNIPFQEMVCRDRVGMISLFPHGNRAAVIGNFLSAFLSGGIKPVAISLSLSAISGLMEERLLPRALNLLSDLFELTG